MKFKCIIIDDEPLAHDVLINYLIHFPQAELKAQFYNVNDARQYLNLNDIDIILLDIKMPGEDGLEFLRTLPSRPITLMTTAFRDYALEGFDLGVLDYLVKPIKQDRFSQGMQRALDFLELKSRNDQIVEPIHLEEEITIKSGTKYIRIKLSNVLFIQGLKDYSIVYTSAAKFVIKGYIKTMETIFKEPLFIRVHKSFIVARDKIKTIDRGKIEILVHHIPVGRAFKDKIDWAVAKVN